MSEAAIAGVRVIEFEGLGPAPTCGMLLADFGAEVLRVSRPGYDAYADPVTSRGKALLAVDLKRPEAIAQVKAAIARADVLIEPFRPGVMERIGLGPDDVMAANPRLIYVRITGWGQYGPLAQDAGHDINYIALTGALEAIGRPGERPTPPLNLIGDMGAGAALAAFGICTALIARQRSGVGQIIDAAIIDGTGLLMSMFRGLPIAMDRENSALGGGQPNYETYRCADGRHVAVGALEQRFWSALIDALALPARFKDRDAIPKAEIHRALTDVFLTRSRDAWALLLTDSDACVSPILSLDEAVAHPHARARMLHRERDGIQHPMPAPRLSRTPGRIGEPIDARALLARWEAAG